MRGLSFLGPIDVPGYPPGRLVRIYEPQRVRSHDRPLLLLFDGQNVFDDKPSFAGGWRAHLSVEKLAKNVSPPLIVGIDHGNERRINELSPFSFGRVEGRAEGFLAWVRATLLPHLRAHHGVTNDRRGIVVGGSSLGGLAALYAHVAMPETFGGSISMSPSFWVGRGAIFDWVRQRHIPDDARFYLDAGAREPGSMVRGAQTMNDLLYEKGIRRLYLRNDPQGTHSETAWRRRLPKALRVQFGTAKGRPF